MGCTYLIGYFQFFWLFHSWDYGEGDIFTTSNQMCWVVLANLDTLMKSENKNTPMRSFTQGAIALSITLGFCAPVFAENIISSVECRSRLGGHTAFTNYNYYTINASESANGDIYSQTDAWSEFGHCKSSICMSNDIVNDQSLLCLSGDYNTDLATSSQSFMQWRVKGSFDSQLEYGQDKRFNLGFHVHDGFFTQGHSNNNIHISLSVEGQLEPVFDTKITQSDFAAGALDSLDSILWESSDGLLAGSTWTMDNRIQGCLENSEALDGSIFNSHVGTYQAATADEVLRSTPVPGVGVGALLGIGCTRRRRRRAAR